MPGVPSWDRVAALATALTRRVGSIARGSPPIRRVLQLLLKISGEPNATVLGSRRVHELADGIEDADDGLVVGLEPTFELIELLSKFFVGANASRSLTKARTT
jgi:hypothetical protein